MKTAGIIAEYNPFHQGHAYQIRECRRQSGCDFLIVLMSGNFVQRGTPAVFDAHSRAEMALRGGADLVLSLPVWSATASAEGFAQGAVRLLRDLHLPEAFSFGLEVPDGKNAAETLRELEQIAALLVEEPEEYRCALRAGLKEGLSFPAARSRAASALLPQALSLLATPNNILAVEYLKALKNTGAPLTPIPVRRIGSAYHDDAPAPLCSAAAVRARLEKTGTLPAEGLPASVLPVYKRLLNASRPGAFLAADDLSELLFYRLDRLDAAELASYADVSPELAARLLQKKDGCFAISELLKAVQCRQLTQTRLMRAFLHIILSLKKDALAAYEALPRIPYTQVLGCRRSALPLLGRLCETASVPILVRPAADSRRLDAPAAALYAVEAQANALYRRLLYQKTGCLLPEENRRRFEPLA